ncbi:MAG: hypothetical protein DHS20C18_02410 [Saprospiraceae bacterium]|nr:MAG: hypothetical protein DHS20C18_02410 [Saprospiraceae bacterium]
MDPKERLDEIEAYLQRQMTAEAEKVFEQKMADDPVLKKEVKLHALTDKAIDLAMEDEIRQMVEEIRQEEPVLQAETGHQPSEPIIVPLWKQRWFQCAVAALVIGIILITGIPYIEGLITPQTIPPPSRPQAINLIDLPAKNAVLGDVPTEDAMEKAKEAFFDHKDYKEAERLFKLAQNDPVTNQTEVTYLLAYTYFMQERFLEAKAIFDRFINEPDKISQLPLIYQSLDKIKWDSMLALLGTNEQEQLRPALEAFIKSDPDPHYGKKAAKLLEELSSE